jgi:pimeloyl-ACP methyl ester carboxylesterase
MKIYLIPGLGADARMYAPQLEILPHAQVLEHLKPIPGEALRAYAARLSALIDTSVPYILIGTSLGGIISVELSRIIHPDKVILISSVKERGELPAWIRAMKYLRLHRVLVREPFLRLFRPLAERVVSRRYPDHARLVLDMYDSSDVGFMKWAINEVVCWDGAADYRRDIIHIQGTKDHLFPHTNIRNARLIEDGPHIMGMTQPGDVNSALIRAINEI